MGTENGLRCQVTLNNTSGRPLEVASSNVDHGAWDPAPPGSLPPAGSAVFAVVGDVGAAGTVTYAMAGGQLELSFLNDDSGWNASGTATAPDISVDIQSSGGGSEFDVIAWVLEL
jgi:hypothetical protein